MTPDGYYECKRCGTSWSSSQLCHCVRCHRSYGGERPFEEHQIVTCGKSTCTADSPCLSKDLRHYPTGREIFCRETGDEKMPDADGRIRTTERVRRTSYKPRGGASTVPGSTTEDEDGG